MVGVAKDHFGIYEMSQKYWAQMNGSLLTQVLS